MRYRTGDFRNAYFAGDRTREVWERVNAVAGDLGATAERLPELALLRPHRWQRSFNAA